MATQIKSFFLISFLTLLGAAYVSSASASNLLSLEGGRKLLYRLRENTFASKVAAPQEVRELKGFETVVDYTPVTTHPPDYDYPSPGEWSSKTTLFHTDYTPVTTHPPDYDYPSRGEFSSKTVGFHTDYTPVTTHPPDYDYPPPGISSSETPDIHTDYAPLRPNPGAGDHDYPPPYQSPSHPSACSVAEGCSPPS